MPQILNQFYIFLLTLAPKQNAAIKFLSILNVPILDDWYFRISLFYLERVLWRQAPERNVKIKIYLNFISMTRLEMIVSFEVKYFAINTNKPDSHWKLM